MLLRFAPAAVTLQMFEKIRNAVRLFFAFFLSREKVVFFCNFLVNVTVELYRYIHSGTGCCKKGHSPSQTIYKDPPKQKKILN